MPEQTPPKKLLPHWQVGQTWKVEYGTWQPSPEKGPVHSPPPPQKTIWRYEVIAGRADDEIKVLSIRQENGRRAFEVRFDPHDLTLLSATELVRGRQLPILENSPHQSWFGYNQTHGVIFDWASLQHKAENHKSEFKTSDGASVHQLVTFEGPDQFKVQMQSKTEPDTGLVENTISSQTWVIGSPWWSKATVRTDYDDKGNKSSIVFIEGRLLK